MTHAAATPERFEEHARDLTSSSMGWRARLWSAPGRYSSPETAWLRSPPIAREQRMSANGSDESNCKNFRRLIFLSANGAKGL